MKKARKKPMPKVTKWGDHRLPLPFIDPYILESMRDTLNTLVGGVGIYGLTIDDFLISGR